MKYVFTKNFPPTGHKKGDVFEEPLPNGLITIAPETLAILLELGVIEEEAEPNLDEYTRGYLQAEKDSNHQCKEIKESQADEVSEETKQVLTAILAKSETIETAREIRTLLKWYLLGRPGKSGYVPPPDKAYKPEDKNRFH